VLGVLAGIEVRARPDPRLAAPPEQVPGRVPRDEEASLLHPHRGKRVRLVLLRGVADPVADGGNPLDAFEDLQGH